MMERVKKQMREGTDPTALYLEAEYEKKKRRITGKMNLGSCVPAKLLNRNTYTGGN